MINDRDLAKQIIERDILNIYVQLPQIASKLGLNISPILNIFQDKILSYADMGVEMLLDLLFGRDNIGDVDEAAEIAKMITNDKIEQYRKKIREEKNKNVE